MRRGWMAAALVLLAGWLAAQETPPACPSLVNPAVETGEVPPPAPPTSAPTPAMPDPSEPLRATAPRPADVLLADLRAVDRERTIRRPMDLRVAVNGAHNYLKHPAFLLKPGEPVELSFETTSGPAPAPSGRYSPGGIVITQRSEIAWSGAPGDLFTPTERGTVLWQSHASDGTPSRVTLEAARLSQSGSDAPVLLEGTRTVLLVPGVRHDPRGDGLLLGYNIGVYPNENAPNVPGTVRDNRARYAPPQVFHLLNEDTRWADLGPHVHLGMIHPPVFPGEGGPRLIVADPRLTRFWAALVQMMQEAGYDAHHLVVLRGFVSPTDRARLAREGVTLSEFSRHLYGDAIAVIWAEKPWWNYGEGATVPPRFGDLNGDGRADIRDVEAFAAVAHDVMKELGTFGGIGICARYEGPGPSAGTPYLHVDLRGTYTPFRQE